MFLFLVFFIWLAIYNAFRMLFLFLFAIPLLAFALQAGIGVLWSLKKKHPLYGKADWLNLLLDYGICLGVGLIPTILAFCLFPRISLWGYSFFYLVLSGLVMLFAPHRLIRKQGWEKNRARARYLALTLFGFSLLELFAFNAQSYRKGEVIIGEGNEIANVIDYHGKLGENEDGFLIEDGDYFIVPKEKGWDWNIAFEFADAPNNTYYLHLTYSDDGKEFVNEWTFQVNPADDDSCVLGLAGDSPYIKVEVEADNSRIHTEDFLELTGIYVNRSLKADFNLVRFGAIAVLVSFVLYLFPICRHYGAFEGNKVRSAYVGAFALTVTALLVFIVISLTNVDYFYLEYPVDTATLNNDNLTSIYYRLFDAFHKGQVNLDIEVDPLLATLENPWSPSEWHRVGASVRWDHAYFDGKYYAYYGPAPVLLLMYPVYWLSGGKYLPGLLFMQIVPTLVLLGVFFLLLIELSIFLNGRVNYLMVGMLFILGIFTSMSLANVTYKEGGYHEGIYHTPIIFGLVFLSLFLLFSFLAYRKVKFRMLYFALACLCFVGMMASRPSLVFAILLALPLYINLLIKERKHEGKLWLSFAPGLAVIVTGGALLAYYNYIRFDSILEFGQSYQMNYDQTELDYAANKLFPSILHFLLQPGKFYNQFPFVSCSVIRYTFEDCPYVQGYYGVFMVPFFLLLLISGFAVGKKEGWEKRAFLFAFPVLLFILAFTTYSKAGVCARYLIEFYYLATLGSAGTWLKLLDRSKDSTVQPYTLSIGFFALYLSSFLGLCLLFDTFDGWLLGDAYGLPGYIKEAFFKLNCIL